MKKILVSSLLLASVALNAAPLLTIGDQTDIYFRGSVHGKWDSNILLASQNAVDDYVATIRLGAEVDYGRTSKFKFNVKAYEELNRYISNSKFDNNLANVFATAAYEEAFYTIDAFFSFRQLAQNSSTVGGLDPITGTYISDLVRRDVYNAGINGSYDFTEKLFGELGFSWYRESFVDYRDVYSDSDTWSIPVSIFYRVTEKISVGLMYQFRYVDYWSGASSFYGNSRCDNLFGVTARAEITAKLSGSIYLGVQNRHMSGVDDLDFSFSGKLDYRATEKITTFLRAFRDFGNGSSRQSVINTGCELGAFYAITDLVKTRAAFAYQNSEYLRTPTNRVDDEIVASVGVVYDPTKYLSLAAGYRYLTNMSNVRDYQQHIIDMSVSIKY